MSTTNLGPQIVKNGMVLDLDASYIRSYSPNVFPNPIDPYAWAVNGGGYQMTLSRDTTMTRQYGSIPLKIVTSGTAAYTATYNASTWNLAPAVSGQTWTFSFWTKGSSNYVASAMIFEANSSGAYLTLGQTYYNVTTSWTRVSGTYTFSNASAAYIQFRIDNYNNGVTQWVDGIQLERSSTATNFNPYYLGNTIWNDVSNSNNSFTVANNPNYSNNFFTLNGTTQFFYISTGTGFFNVAGNNFYADVTYAWTISVWFRFPVSPTSTRNSGNNGGNCSYCMVGNSGGIGGAETLALFVSGGDNTTSAGSLAPYFCVVGIRGAKTQLSDGSVNTNTWNNVVVTWNGSAGRGYFNGVDKGALNIGSAGIQINGAYTVGTTVGGNQGSHTYEGDISSANVYNRALTATEVLQNYNATKSRFGL